MASKIPAALLLSALALAACDESGNDDAPAETAVQSFGPSFAAAFAQDRNDEPIDAQEIALVLTPYVDPVDF